MLAYEPHKKVNKEEIVKLYEKGLTGEEIARTLQIPWSRVWPIVKKLKREEKTINHILELQEESTSDNEQDDWKEARELLQKRQKPIYSRTGMEKDRQAQRKELLAKQRRLEMARKLGLI